MPAFDDLRLETPRLVLRPPRAEDLQWHALRHGGACRLLADGVDIRIIQLMLGHASIQQTQRSLNVTDEDMRRALEMSWRTKADRFAWRRGLIGLVWFPKCPRFVPGNWKFWLRGLATR